MDYNPLVSVGILTYNSAKYIIDALESVKNQTYQNIELIVSDDCSKDNTVEICRKWIEENRSRFVNATLLTVEKNTGTSANGNRRLAACKGEWLKGLAGDDALFPDCIKSFIEFVQKEPEAKCVVGCVREYINTFEEKNVIKESHSMHFNNNDPVLQKSAKEEFQKLIYGNTFIPPAVFVNVQVMRSLGGYDEKYGVLEDHPFYLKLLRAGYKIYGIDRDVVKYRSSDTNLWANAKYLFNFKHKQMDYYVKRDICFPYYKRIERVRCRLFYLKFYLMNKLGLRSKTRFNRAVEILFHFSIAIVTFDIKQIRSYFKSIIKH